MSEQNPFRIISLLPGATETIAALGLTDALVGRSHECDYPPQVQNLPVCTEARINSKKDSAEIDTDIQGLVQSALNIYEVKTDVIEQLQPTHILTQDQCDVCAVSMSDLENSLAEMTGSKPQVISLKAGMLTEVWVEMKKVAQTLGVDSQAALDNLQSRVRACTQKTDELSENDKPTVVTLEWTDPLMATGNWIPELVKMAGGKPAFGVTGDPAPHLEWNSLLEADPDAIIVMPCGFDLERTREESQTLTQRPGWSQMRSIQNAKVFITDGNAYFNRPGPRLVDSLEILAEILHPDQFDYGYQGTAWEHLTMPAQVQ
ncbi:MAG: cobalamin-binding protein [Cyanobacteria bacterium QS_1_48_34]|nr:MAG: cobalamin-binding protein [Cyanobacteria bacterium QS_1_48_34]